MITITTRAAEQIRQAALQAEGEPGALRIAAQRTADGMIEYGMGFDAFRENDIEIVVQRLMILISPHSEALLAGITLDFVAQTAGEPCFVFLPPDDCAADEACDPECGDGGCSSGNCG